MYSGAILGETFKLPYVCREMSCATVLIRAVLWSVGGDMVVVEQLSCIYTHARRGQQGKV